MDDLDHSVLIAERDWDSFYEESEECSLQQARLAGLDDSGLSDTDDEYNSTQESTLPHQTDTGKPNEEHGAASSQALSAAHEDCEVGKPSEERFCYEAELQTTAQISLNHSASTCANFTSDRGVIDIPPDGLTDNASDTNNFKEHNQSQSEDKFSQVKEEPITINSLLCTQNSEHAGTAEGETVTKVMEISPTPQKEKERWFVTVNDSPVQQSGSSGTSGQKKRRKKKTSRKLSQLSIATGGQQCPHSSNKKEAERKKNKKGQKVQNDFKEPIHRSSEYLNFNTFPDNVNEDAASVLTTTQHVDLAIAKEPLESSIPNNIDEKFSFSSRSNDNKIDVPTENPENNPSTNPSLNSQPSSLIINTSQLQANIQQVPRPTTQLADNQSTFMGLANNSTSNTDITTPNQQPMSNDSNDVNDDPHTNCSQIIFRVSSTISSSDEQHENQEYSAQCNEEENMSSSLQDAQNEEHQGPPNQSLKAAEGPSRPIYALSSFWDEMEKLTINDILHLRVANSCPALHDNPARLLDTALLDSKDTDLQDSILVDDSADSDYFTHVDDSKPDRSSCEFSTLSDFDEEFLQIISTGASPSPEPQSLKQSESFSESIYTSELLTEQDLGLTTVNHESQSEDIIMLCPQDGLPLYLYPATDVQNIYLEHKPECCKKPFELEVIRKTPSLVLSVDDILDDQCLMQFSDGEVSPTRCSPILSFYSSKSLSVPETYDDFFSDFVVGNLFFPSVQDQTVPIPIFSSSRSVVRDMVFPEAEEMIESDFEDNNCPIRVMTRFSNQQESSTDPSGTPNLFFFASQRRNWRSLLSLRRISFIGKGSTWCQKVSSWIFPSEAKQVISYGSRAQPVPHLHLETQHFQHCAEQQNYMHHTALKREGLLFSIKQADMCLVCIAFASWVLKSSNPQSTDMWKAALLANVSALSAIQYLRKYEKKEGTEDDP
ncbi:hypothetical protein AMEX_G7142 [Astyanax mexicanus]|uniref:PGC-1 and ERR-induced regulator in muscle protein 1 n=1 Tax=Astyanax mexicanus TaxID=7994 RepID=A0A8B9L616_ASTMX|nr:hypothetical protein AMEX_G7142 [Astyanax mexicanus]